MPDFGTPDAYNWYWQGINDPAIDPTTVELQDAGDQWKTRHATSGTSYKLHVRSKLVTTLVGSASSGWRFFYADDYSGTRYQITLASHTLTQIVASGSWSALPQELTWTYSGSAKHVRYFFRGVSNNAAAATYIGKVYLSGPYRAKMSYDPAGPSGSQYWDQPQISVTFHSETGLFGFNSNLYPPVVQPPDTDGDTIPDDVDLDDDGDGTPDIADPDHPDYVPPGTPDSDGDGTPDNLDSDDDGDGIPDVDDENHPDYVPPAPPPDDLGTPSPSDGGSGGTGGTGGDGQTPGVVVGPTPEDPGAVEGVLNFNGPAVEGEWNEDSGMSFDSSLATVNDFGPNRLLRLSYALSKIRGESDRIATQISDYRSRFNLTTISGDVTSFDIPMPSGSYTAQLPLNHPGISIFRNILLFCMLLGSAYQLFRMLKV